MSSVSLPPTPDQSRAIDVVILNQYYAPDVASTGQLLHELAVELAKIGCRVSVVTSHPSYGPRETWVKVPSHEIRDGVDVRRMRTTRFSKDRLLGRVLNFSTFIVPLGLRMLFGSSRKKVYLYTTNPPFLGIIGAVTSVLRTHTYVQLLHDSHPQLGVWVGTFRKGGLVERVWHAMNRRIYRRAARTIVLCEAAKALVCRDYGIDPARVHVIPNWADEDVLVPRPKRETRFAAVHGLVEPFTLLYSGNLGLYYEFETLLGAAERLNGESFRLVFVGSGGKRAWLAEQIARRGLKNTMLLPYQPSGELPDSLNACDASLVTIARGIEGISFPSKLYSCLAVGKPIMALSESRSELRDLVEKHDVGRWAEVGDVEGVVRAVKGWMEDLSWAEAQGRNARRLFESGYTRGIAARRYAEVLGLAAKDRGIIA